MKQGFIALVASLSALAGCGGGSSNPAPDGALDDPSAPTAGPGCGNDYYARVIGEYSGTVTYLESIAAGTTGTSCVYDLSMQIAGQANTFGRCNLRAQITSDVEQIVVQESIDPVASQCIAGTYAVDLDDPFTAIRNPVEGQDYTLPVRYSFTGRFDAPSSGPYFGDESRIVRYVDFFGGLVPAVDFITVADGLLTLEQRNPSPMREIDGELVKR